jgi:hypothetical protein
VTHDELFESYVSELRAAKESSEAWWSELVAEATPADGDAKLGEAVLRERWPFGPTSHPWVIAVFRKYWLACHALNLENEALGPEDREPADPDEGWGEEAPAPTSTVPPRVFTIERLADGEHDDLYEFMLSLLFVPIGLRSEEPV